MNKFQINKKRLLISLLIGTLLTFLTFYVFLPPINPRSAGFWWFLTFAILFYTVPYFISLPLNLGVHIIEKNGAPVKKAEFGFNKKVLAVAAAPIVFLIIFSILSSPLFNARKYASVIEVKDSVFTEDLPESGEVTNIALMDTASATILGNRKLGSLASVVSQFTVSDTYSQINYKNTPQKIANLEYDGFFKWLGNRESGVPGMVMVDPVKSEATYIEFSDGLRYVESAFFGEDLTRKLRFSFPTKIFGHVSFEINDEGKPYYVVACSSPKVGLFGAYDVSEVILFDPVSGTGELMAVTDVPEWVDIVYDGYLASDKYNWLGSYSGGFLNSIIGNVGCKQTTDDFGYVVLNDDVWYFTGVTSVSADESNIGFILTNARTGEYRFYPVIGAEEHSAMSAAQGEVQEKGYIASFPSLVNIAGQPTYIMVLKDDAGLVKLYALVNVENYSRVVTGQTQAEVITAYKKLLGAPVTPTEPEGAETKDVTLENVRIVPLNGQTAVFLTATDGTVYEGILDEDLSLITLRVGDAIRVKSVPTSTEGVRTVLSWTRPE